MVKEGRDVMTGGKTILIVEDEETVREVIGRLLTNAGYTVYSADSPQTALVNAKAFGKIDLLITDVILPGMNGKCLADILVRGNGEMKVLYISGYAEDAFVHNGILAEETNFLQKPFASASLAGKISEILHEPAADLGIPGDAAQLSDGPNTTM
jgi:two-component system cell cycle sensor histidine kinase/response regulator CckA